MVALHAQNLLKPVLVSAFLAQLTARLALGNFGVLVINLVALPTSSVFVMSLLRPSTVVLGALSLWTQELAT